jgi:threonine synthase
MPLPAGWLNHDVPMITLATAHPAKFPDAVEQASGVRPGLPQRMGDLMNRKEVFDVLPNSLEEVKATSPRAPRLPADNER